MGYTIVSIMKNIIYNEDCITGLLKLADNSIDVCITDPPYNYEFVGHNWDYEEIKRRTDKVKNSNSNTLIKYIPYGSGLSGGVRNERWYKKNADNINEYRKWVLRWGEQVFRVLKPGAFILVFNSTRTIAHVQVALEEAGFYARDIIVWRKNSGIPKGINLEKKLEKDGVKGASKWHGWNSALRNEWESIVLLQKPLENNYPTTAEKWGVGVMKTVNEDGSFQSNIIENIPREQKEDYNIHCTVKPLSLIKKLIQLTVPLDEKNVVLDPFMGSGTTAVAASELNIGYVGFEIVPEYIPIIEHRVNGSKHKS